MALRIITNSDPMRPSHGRIVSLSPLIRAEKQARPRMNWRAAFGRVLRTGLSPLRGRAGSRLAPSGFNPIAQGEGK